MGQKATRSKEARNEMVRKKEEQKVPRIVRPEQNKIICPLQ
jgi:hypothetical protein